METNPFSIENILKKDSQPSCTPQVSSEDEEPKSIAALSLAAKLAGESKLLD
jgi:hypothetical protein